MKTLYYKYLLVLLFIPVAGCSFLDIPPYDEFTNEDFWKTEEETRAFMYGFYPSVFSGYGTSYSNALSLISPGSTDDICEQNQTNLGPTYVPVSDGNWNFTNVRKANYVIHNVSRVQADSATVRHWRGVARFFRACYYSGLVFTFGDVPWYDTLCTVSDKKEDLDYLYKDRDRRTYVDSMIINDFDYAMQYVREDDGKLQVNRYVVAAMASRYLLREGTYLKYHNLDADMAATCLQKAKDAAELVMSKGKYSIAPSFNALFTSEDLFGNPEIIMYRHYLDGILTHCMLAINYSESQEGCSRSLADAFLCDDGQPVYVKNGLFWAPKTDTEYFANRDPRLSLCIRPKYLLKGMNCAPYGYTYTGFSWKKYADDNAKSTTSWALDKNTTDAPCIRYAEVLLNYAEAAYELSLMGKGTFAQADLDKSINLIRARNDVNMPALQMAGDQPMVGGITYDDPMRISIESNANGPMTDALLWEIRRERRVELCFEGFRKNDLKRWGKYDYVWNTCNPDIRYGAYIVKSNYNTLDKTIVLEDTTATEGYILRNTEGVRERPIERDYLSPIPQGQITLYEAKGYHLTQNPGW